MGAFFTDSTRKSFCRRYSRPSAGNSAIPGMRVIEAIAASMHASGQRRSYAKVSDHAQRQKYNASAYTAVKKNENGKSAISHTVRADTSAPASVVASRSTATSPSRNDADDTISPPTKNACSKSRKARNGSDTIHDTHE